MRILTCLPTDDLRAVPDRVGRAERDGFDGVFTLENRHDPFLPLGVAALHSETLRLRTGSMSRAITPHSPS